MKEQLLAELTYHLVNTVALTAIVSIFVLWRYRVSVLAGMDRDSGQTLPLPAPAPAHRNDALAPSTLAARLARERRGQRLIALAYVLTTLGSALPLALAVAYLSGIRPIYPSRVMMIALMYAFTCAPMIAASLSLPGRRAFAGMALLTVLLTSMVVVGEVVEDVFLGRHIGWQQLAAAPRFLGLLPSQMWLMALFWVATWPRKVRGIAPLSFGTLLIFGAAPFLSGRLNATADGGAAPQLTGAFLVMAVPAGWLAWTRLSHLARSYERKRLSDAQLLSQAWWHVLVVNVGLQTIVYPREWVAVAAAATALLTFAPLNALLLRGVRRNTMASAARNLLLLRVFGYTRRTERLFDRVGARWRLVGPISVIGAPDVIARTIGPGDYLRWLTGRIDDLFVTSPADLAAKLDALDVAPDPDGRYRVNVFCCHRNTWQATVVELIERSDVVVVDLRGLTRARHGCEFELQQLAQRLPPRRLVLVVDSTTERAVLETTFGAQLVDVRIVEVSRSRNIDPVFEALLDAAA
jgi:hypothetical protein